MSSRERLVQYRRASLTADTAEAMRLLESKAAKVGNLRLEFSGPGRQDLIWEKVRENPGPTGSKPEWSMLPSGREVYLKLHFAKDEGPEESRDERALAMLWALAIPAGFTPWNRYPLPGVGDNVFHYLGPWQVLYDHLLSLGRGEEAWPSVAAACQTDVGTWEGPRGPERFLQAQLHRLGINVGPIDGIIGEVTTAGLQRAGLSNVPVSEAAEKLTKMQPPKPKDPDQQHIGHVVIPSHKFSIVCSGQVFSTKTATGAALTIKGAGRVVLDIQ